MRPVPDHSDFLSQILLQKQREVEAAKERIPENHLRNLAEKPRGGRPFFEPLATPGPHGVNIIAEIKRASPSGGPIRPNLDISYWAKAYERGGASAISILTDREYFQGDLEDLHQVRAITHLPLLRKDFVISTYQLYESVVMGADAVLLIVRVLPWKILKEYLELCRELQLDALVEIHTEAELEQATRAGAQCIGVNNRDLRTFRTDVQTSVRLARRLAHGQVAVAESGIGQREDVEKLLGMGIWNFLIGESLLRSTEPEQFLRHLLGY